MLDEVNISFLCQLDRLCQAVSAFADEKPVHRALCLRRGADSKNEENRTILQKMLHAVVENFAHGRMVLTHHALYAIDRTNHVGFIDHVASADTDKEIFRVIRHADDLVRQTPRLRAKLSRSSTRSIRIGSAPCSARAG